jgi:signal transduction histidine kinase
MLRPSSWFEWPAKLSRNQNIAIQTALVFLIGLVDYASGWQVSWSTVYAYPIALTALYVGVGWAYALSLLSVVLYTAGDVATGFQFDNWLIPVWNALIRLVFYVILIHMLVYIRALTLGLEMRVLERTAELRREIAERERLERELLEVGERERRRLGFDLHDGLCQHLTGTALAVQVLKEKLTRRGIPEAAEAAKAVDLIEDGIALSRKLAKGLQPVEMHAGGLMQALQEFSAATTELFKVTCRFECDAPILFSNISTADHLYHIAREATANAIKHGHAHDVVISLEARDEGTVLTVTDDGSGIPMPLPKKGGMGLTIMAQRAKLIGASFDIRPAPDRGTIVTCVLPHPVSSSEIAFETSKQRDPHYV